MITVRVSNKQWRAEGCSGSYYRVNGNLGVKVGPDSFELLEEFRTLTRLHKRVPGRWPQPYSLVWVKVVGEEGKQKGLMMEHIEGKMLAHYEHDDTKKSREIFEKFSKKASASLSYCRRRGINWGDDHEENIIVSKNRVRFVDAENVDVFREPKKRKKR